MLTAEHTMQHQLEYELLQRELRFLNDEVELLKNHLGDIYYTTDSEEVLQQVQELDQKFMLQKEWLTRMSHELENLPYFNRQSGSGEKVKESFNLQMQANRIVNEELKNSLLKLFS